MKVKTWSLSNLSLDLTDTYQSSGRKWVGNGLKCLVYVICWVFHFNCWQIHAKVMRLKTSHSFSKQLFTVCLYLFARTHSSPTSIVPSFEKHRTIMKNLFLNGIGPRLTAQTLNSCLIWKDEYKRHRSEAKYYWNRHQLIYGPIVGFDSLREECLSYCLLYE